MRAAHGPSSRTAFPFAAALDEARHRRPAPRRRFTTMSDPTALGAIETYVSDVPSMNAFFV
ncbi:hypothetical protein AB0C76_23745 [Kitasatospora sp. NPDC048722]|uniref:hypothetical protein n=1 Tax=Kitasatospora sp. NPDC048722 TaxID=3155639 RepID=UPI0033E179F1